MKKNITFVFAAAAIVLFSCGDDNHPPQIISPSSNIALKPSVIGMNIPELKLKAFYNGRIVDIDLKQYRGRWVILFFYPSDYTIVCPTELKELADYHEDFKKAGAEIFSVSTDSVFVHKAWHNSNDLVKTVKFPMLSDRNGDLSKILGVYNPLQGTSHRATFLFDQDGHCIAHEVHHDAIGRSAGELLRKVDAANAVKTGGGGVCSGGWKTGDELLKPDSK